MPVNRVKQRYFHANQRSWSRDPAQFSLTVDFQRLDRAALGPVLGGVITTNWSWRGIFLVNVPIGLLAIALTAWKVEESKSPRPTPPDWAGFALWTGALVRLVYGLIRAGETSWSDAGVITCLVTA